MTHNSVVSFMGICIIDGWNVKDRCLYILTMRAHREMTCVPLLEPSNVNIYSLHCSNVFMVITSGTSCKISMIWSCGEHSVKFAFLSSTLWLARNITWYKCSPTSSSSLTERCMRPFVKRRLSLPTHWPTQKVPLKQEVCIS